MLLRVYCLWSFLIYLGDGIYKRRIYYVDNTMPGLENVTEKFPYETEVIQFFVIVDNPLARYNCSNIATDFPIITISTTVLVYPIKAYVYMKQLNVAYSWGTIKWLLWVNKEQPLHHSFFCIRANPRSRVVSVSWTKREPDMVSKQQFY